VQRFLHSVPGLEIPDITFENVKLSIVPGALFVANIVVGWYGLRLVSLPLFLAVRRTNAAFTLLAEAIMLKKLQTTEINASVGLIVLGAIIAGAPTLNADWLGFAYTLGNNVMTASSMTTTKRFSDATGIKGFGVVLYNALIALPICLVGAVVTGEFEYLWGAGSPFKYGYDPVFWTAVLIASILGVYMSYIVFLCTTVNSPLATSITGNMKDIGATIVAALVFRDFTPTIYNTTGLVVSFVGAGWFSWCKLSQSREQSEFPSKSRDISSAPDTADAATAPGEVADEHVGILITDTAKDEHHRKI
jgi:solute carrier family 35 protein